MGSERIQEFDENIWIVNGPIVRDMGIRFTTRMVLVKLHDGSLWVESPVSIPLETLAAVKDLGPVRYLVAATPRHVWRLSHWHNLFPEAQLWMPRPSPMTLKRDQFLSAHTLSNEPSPEWSEDLDQLAFAGNPLIEEVIFFHKKSRTVMLDDLIQNHRPIESKPLRNAFFKFCGVLYPQGGVPLDIRLTFFQRGFARQSLQKLLSWDFDKLIIAHGACVDKEAKDFVQRAFRWLSTTQG